VPPGLGAGIGATPTELGDDALWVAAKFEAPSSPAKPRPGLRVLANHDPVQLNSRSGKPLRIVDARYTRGLYCHAVSKVLVRLPGPGEEFTAIVGVDSNDDTRGGKGSVHFLVGVAAQNRFRTPLMREGMAGLPVKVPLDGADELVLEVDDGGDGIGCDQADWAEAKVKLKDGTEVWLADLGLAGAEIATEPPFTFMLDGKPWAELIKTWQVERSRHELDANRTEHVVTYSDPKTGLEARCRAVEYRDFPTVEWTVYFKNSGQEDSPVLSEICALDTHWQREGGSEWVLHHQVGTLVAPSDFKPLTTRLEPNHVERLGSQGGRPCAGVWPYFNLEWGPEGMKQGAIIAVGWPGQWTATFTRDREAGLRVTAGQGLTHLRLKPGEEIRTPLMVLQFWRGDWLRAQNLWRRWMVAWNIPRPGGKLPAPLLTPCSSHQFGEMIHANEQNQMEFIDRYQEEGFAIDYWWMDAGWYVNRSGWPNTGTWLVDSNRFPHGLRAITDHGHAHGVKSIVWFEPERVTGGTWLAEKHPEWLLKGTLLDLGNPQARQWLTDHIDHLLSEQGIDLYRQDYNIDPLEFWRSADAPDRQGITENHYVTGYLAYWDELRRRRPGMLIDSCASGGHRNDLETMRRSVPFLRSDYIFDPLANQCHSYGLAFWLPYNGTGTGPRQFSLYELRSNMSCPKQTPCWDLRERGLPYAVLRKAVREWRSYADDYLGDFYPLTPYSLEREAWMAWQFDQPEKRKGVVQAFRRDASIYETARVKLHGLEPRARYRVTDLDATGPAKEYSGEELMSRGLALSIAEMPGATVLTYQAVAE
jgi:alpha-galactosidase